MNKAQIDALDFTYLLLEYYKKFHISENELSVILMIEHLIAQNNNLVTPDLLSLKMSLSTSEIDKIFVELINKGYLFFDPTKKTKVSLKPLKRKLVGTFQKELNKEEEISESEEKNNTLKNIYSIYERELNRPLSPLEYSQISEWIEQGNSEERIIDALKEAASKGKKNFKAIDKILLQWQARDDIEKNGYTSISEDWNKNLDETLEIVKTKWVDD